MFALIANNQSQQRKVDHDKEQHPKEASESGNGGNGTSQLLCLPEISHITAIMLGDVDNTSVFVSRFPDNTALLTIRDPDRRHNWQHMQRIKNEVLGEDWAGVEVYPRQDLVVDEANLLPFVVYSRTAAHRLGRWWKVYGRPHLLPTRTCGEAKARHRTA